MIQLRRIALFFVAAVCFCAGGRAQLPSSQLPTSQPPISQAPLNAEQTNAANLARTNLPGAIDPRQGQVPEVLKPWIPWALWDDGLQRSPPTFRNASERIAFWVSKAEVNVEEQSGTWKFPVRVFHDSWVQLPGGGDYWPVDVTADGEPIVVVEHSGYPAVRLAAGEYRIEGKWKWNAMPQKLRIPRAIGWVELMIRGEAVVTPTWDTNADLWLSRTTPGVTEKDLLNFQIYRLIEDGSPIWLRTAIELTATGKSREEELGVVLPDGWQLSYVTSPIPVAVDESGRLKAQVRAGNWTILLDAFRTEDTRELAYSPANPPALASELIALRSAPHLRLVELQGVTPIDVQMTRFPEKWRDLSVFEWKTANPASLVEKSRGIGLVSPNQLSINRTFWLDDNGGGFTYADQLKGEPKQITRLDVSPAHKLGVARIYGVRQLITQSPVNGAQGFELRMKKAEIDAIGRAENVENIPATGWQIGAKSLEGTFYLPPGWRMLALLGPDRVEGDWLTAWSLLDLFLLLVLTLAVFRLYGFLPALIALVAFGLSYHEPGSPRWTWFLLLVPVALLRVVGSDQGRKGLMIWKNIALGVLLLNLLPFAAAQIQNAIYPQLEPSSIPFRNRTLFQWMDQTSNGRFDVIAGQSETFSSMSLESEAPNASNVPSTPLVERANSSFASKQSNSYNQQMVEQVANLQYDPKTSIQTGIAKPQWVGNTVRCFWDGPVSPEESIRPVLISCHTHRLLTIVRLALLLALLGLLLAGESTTLPWVNQLLKTSQEQAVTARKGIGVLFLAIVSLCSAANTAFGQVPDQATLEVLKNRLKLASDAFPNAADIPTMTVSLSSELQANGTAIVTGLDRIQWNATVHATQEVAIPLPGKLPTWFPQKVLLDGVDGIVTQRDDGYLWLLVPEGIHRVEVTGRITESAEWILGFQLLPRSLEITAPDWTWSGVNAEGKPDTQVIFTRKKQLAEGQANYDQRNYRSVFLVERRLEIGLVWKVQTIVRRLSRTGKAVSLIVPLLEQEQVIAPGLTNRNGSLEINFSADDKQFTWESEIPPVSILKLSAARQVNGDTTSEGSNPSGLSNTNLVEQWRVESSPVWSMQWSGLEPIFDEQSQNLVPVWYPWPGETVSLSWNRPVAVPGKLLTIQGLVHQMEIGYRQRQSILWFEIESSLGGEQGIELPQKSKVTSVKIGGRAIPIRQQGDACLITLQPGAQQVEILWNNDQSLESVVPLSQVKMPDEVANVRLVMKVPSSRWILWANGPIRGPAVRFWVILAVAIIAAIVLGWRSDSPLKTWEWVLLAIGLTQVSVVASVLFVAWLFSIPAKERLKLSSLHPQYFRAMQVFHVLLTIVALGILISVVTAGLLGSPRMFIVGNNSSDFTLQWFTPMSGKDLPKPWILSISIWYYRLMMLLWALWLANSLLRWLMRWWRAWNRTQAPEQA
jgi:hypothetical protein